MLDSGRARTFKQRNSEDVQQAVASCPVNCMHPVAYTELEEYETARDNGDGRTDHKHLGHSRGNTPLHVAGMDSDNNHRTSWYHTLKGNCVGKFLIITGNILFVFYKNAVRFHNKPFFICISGSLQCPQKGCYDCPKFGKPGKNPYFQERLRKDEHIRAQYFLDRGDVDDMRKTTDL
jgi:hypothetical protein